MKHLIFVMCMLFSISAFSKDDLKDPQQQSDFPQTQKNECISKYSVFVANADSREVVEQSGCCSWHGGVCGCSGGRAQCCDGALSPSCGC